MFNGTESAPNAMGLQQKCNEYALAREPMIDRIQREINRQEEKLQKMRELKKLLEDNPALPSVLDLMRDVGCF